MLSHVFLGVADFERALSFYETLMETVVARHRRRNVFDPCLAVADVLQDLLQGFHGPRAGEQIIESFASLPLIQPELEDYIEAARWRNQCRRKGVQVGTIDALIAQLCIRYDLLLLVRDHDFQHMAKHTPLSLPAVK